MKRFLFISTGLFISLFFISSHENIIDNSQPITFTILQINDVYEIEPLSGGKEGGMARIATIRKQLAQQNPNTIAVLAGDFLSPSFMGTLKYNNQPLAGRQMVEVMNNTGIDYVTFGNHEFDIKKSLLQERINESDFTWVSCNVKELTRTGTEQPFTKRRSNIVTPIRPYTIHTFSYDNGKKIKLGIIGVTLPFNKADSVRYTDVYDSFKNTYNTIKDSCDVIIGLTHLEIGMDQKLAAIVPDLNLIIGGHEHNNMTAKVGNVMIYKADANAKTAYIHKFTIIPGSKNVEIHSELKHINSSVNLDNEVNKTINKWTSFRDSILTKEGFNGSEKLMRADIPLEGKESFVRFQSTNFTKLIASSLRYAFPTADASIFNSGSLRIDDELQGDILQADILRSLPFGGSLSLVNVSGKDLIKIVDIGTAETQKGNGGYLQMAGIEKTNGKWHINNQVINENKTYRVVMPTFLTLGKEANLGFIINFKNTTSEKFENTKIDNSYNNNDIRNAVIAYIKSGMKNPLWENK